MLSGGSSSGAASCLALVDRHGRRPPAVAVLAPLWSEVVFLPPIALGLPFGLLAQAFAGAPPRPRTTACGTGSTVVYGGFLVQGVSLGSAL